MGLKDRADMAAFVLWKDHCGFNESGFSSGRLGRQLWHHSMNSVEELMPAYNRLVAVRYERSG